MKLAQATISPCATRRLYAIPRLASPSSSLIGRRIPKSRDPRVSSGENCPPLHSSPRCLDLLVTKFAGFVLEQCTFAVESPAVACQISVGAHHAMARRHNRNGIGGARPCDRTDCTWLPNGSRDFRVGASGPVRNSLQFFPNMPAECGSLYV